MSPLSLSLSSHVLMPNALPTGNWHGLTKLHRFGVGHGPVAAIMDGAQYLGAWQSPRLDRHTSV